MVSRFRDLRRKSVDPSDALVVHRGRPAQIHRYEVDVGVRQATVIGPLIKTRTFDSSRNSRSLRSPEGDLTLRCCRREAKIGDNVLRQSWITSPLAATVQTGG